MLQIVSGPSGAGKSHIVYEELIRDSMREPERDFFVLVPEQFTMRTQDDLVKLHPRRGLLNVDVLSFQRLAYRVFEEVGGNTRPILDDIGKSLVVQKVIAEKKKELGALSRALARHGAAEQMKSLISELLQYRVEPEDLDDWIETFSARHAQLAGKLADVRIIFQAFRDHLADQYLTTEELLQVLCGVIGRSSLLRGSTVVLDGFTGFTPVQYEVIRELLSLCDSVIVIVTASEGAELSQKNGEHQLFYMSAQMVQRLTELAREAGTEISELRRIVAGEKSRHANSGELARLEHTIFRYGGGSKAAGDRQIIHQIFLSKAADPAEEILAVAETICRRVREEGIRYRDIAVVTGDLETYGRLAEEIFAEAGIPTFIDQKESVWTNALVEFIRSAMNLLPRRHSYESVLRYLRCPFSGFEADEVDRMENYILATGVRGFKRYREPWVRRTKRMEQAEKRGRCDGSEATGELAALNALRARFAESTGAFVEAMRAAKTVGERTRALYDLLVKMELQARCEKAKALAEENGDAAEAKAYAQIYPKVIDLMDRMVEVLGDEPVSQAEYQKLLEAGFGELRIGFVPSAGDPVTVGDIERTRLADIRVLFFVGVNEGVIPRTVATTGLLTGADRALLANEDIELSPTASEELGRQRFYLYLTLTKPSESLYLSYSAAGVSGERRSPSYLIPMIKKLFPDLEERLLSDPEHRGAADLLETPRGRDAILLSGVRGEAEADVGAFRELERALRDSREGCEKLELLAAAAAVCNRDVTLGPELAAALYGTELYNSATRLEEFAKCPFAHFLKYGLRLQEREEYKYTSLDLGNIMHEALERFTGRIAEQKLDWALLEDGQRERFADEALDAVAYGYGASILDDSNYNRYQIDRIRRVLKKTVWALQEQLKRGRFKVAAAEEEFSGQETGANRIEAEGMRVQLIGKIDRKDICEEDGRRYVRVIDYKTGETRFDWNLLYEGVQLQLALYMNAAVEKEKQEHPGQMVEPAGMFYYHVEDPVLKSEKEIEKATLKQLRLSGLVRSEREVLELIDEDYANGTESSVVDVKLRKETGEPDKNAAPRIADREMFALVCDYAHEKARSLAGRIAGGEAQIRPYQTEERAKDGGTELHSQCVYCKCKTICGFDRGIPGYAFRRISKTDREEIVANMRRELDGSAGEEA